MTQSELELQDLIINANDVTLLNDSSVFNLEKKPTIPYLEESTLLQGIQIDMDPDLTIIERNGYTVLDILSDVGGIQGIFDPQFAVF